MGQIIKGPSTLLINRAAIPNVGKFIDKVWESTERNERSLALREIDFSKAVFGCPLREHEKSITGEVKLQREKEEDEKFLRLDSGIGIALYQEPNQATLRFLHDIFRVTWMEFTGDILCYSNGSRHFLNLFRYDIGSWGWRCHWLENARNARDFSVRVRS